MPKPRVVHYDPPNLSDDQIRLFKELSRQHAKDLFNLAYRMTGNRADAEDLTQETLVRAYRFFNGYRADWSFLNWTAKIAYNIHIDETRRSAHRHRGPSLDAKIECDDDAVDRDIMDPRGDPAGTFFNNQFSEPVTRALNALPADFCQTVMLADIENFSYEEIAIVMKTTIGTVRSRLHRGRKLLRDKLNVRPSDTNDPAIPSWAATRQQVLIL